MRDFHLRTPVVMVVFNRPDHTRRVFERIREMRPERLFVLADAPRDHVPTDAARAVETRAIVDLVDWNCKVETDFAPRNLGCSGRIFTGLDRVFDEVEQAIVLEDDIIPHPTFFRYCQELLDRYRDNPRVHAITGGKYPCEPRTTPHSYRFSRMFNCWGWAGWRRAWRTVDKSLSTLPQFQAQGWIDRYATSRREVDFYMNGFVQAHARKIEIWDWSVMYSAYLQEQLFVVPDRNLISNIGWGPEATQQKNTNHILANLPVFPLDFPLRHPDFVTPDKASDRAIYDLIGPLTGPRFVRSVRKRLRRRTRNRYVALQAGGEA